MNILVNYETRHTAITHSNKGFKKFDDYIKEGYIWVAVLHGQCSGTKGKNDSDEVLMNGHYPGWKTKAKIKDFLK